MQALTEFQFGDKEIRVVVDETTNEPLWVAKDICEVLQYKNIARALDKLDDDEKGVQILNTLGGEQKMSVVNESGLYTLILRSNKPEAKKFKKWVTAEVLPTIRKTGSYSIGKATDTNTMVLEMMKMQSEFMQIQLKQTDAIIELVKTIKQTPQLTTAQPQVQYLDSRDRKKLRDAISEKAKEVASELGVSTSTIKPSIWIDLKNFFDVDDYQDIPAHKSDQALNFITSWKPYKEKIDGEFYLDEDGKVKYRPLEMPDI